MAFNFEYILQTILNKQFKRGLSQGYLRLSPDLNPIL